MIILLAKDGKYSIGNDFPIFTIPLKMDGATSQSLEDFQWWAYSSDFRKWLEKNPRQWVADSEDMSKYADGDISQIIRESLGGSGYSLDKAIREINEYLDNEENRVATFSDFKSSAIFEDDSKKSNVKEGEEKAVKLAFSYNKLLSEGKLEDYAVADQSPGKDKAVFLCLEDAESGENRLETLDAYKIAPLEISNPDAKFRLFEIKDRIISGPLPEDATGPTMAQEALNKGIQYGVYAVAAGGVFAGIKYLGQGIALRQAWKGVKFLRTGKDTVKSTKYLRMLVTTKNGLKSIWGAVSPMKAISFWGKIGKAGVEGAKLQRALGAMEGAGLVAKAAGMVKGFVTGAKAAAGTAKAAEWTNPIGWALLAIGAVGSAWNWYSGNQAPRLGQVEDFAKDAFDPKSIKIGVPITICWSQPAGGWGIAISFLFNNETRTTMELVKVAERNGKSIFILTQINAKEIQKQIADYDITLLAFDNSDVVETGWIDNEDLDFDMLSIKQDLNSLFNFQGACDWNLFQDEFNKAQSTLLVSDPNAPDEYEFHFSDSEDNIINVVGTKVSTEELSKYSDEDINRIFGVTISKETESRLKTQEGGEKKEKEAEVMDSLKHNYPSGLLESQVITKFSDFKRNAYGVLEAEGGVADAAATVAKGNPKEGSDDADSKTKSMPALTPEQMSGPAEIAIYLVTERDYADPKLRGKYETGEFTNFLLDPKDWEARNGASIEVDPNTDEILEDSVRGLYTYVEKKEEEKPVVKDEVQDADDDDNKPEEEKPEPVVKQDDYYITVSPEDVEIKNRKSSTVIKDTSLAGGINLFDTMLTPQEKEALKIENWKTVTFAKENRDNKGDIIEVKLKNKYAPFGDKSRKYRATDGEAFEIAKKFVEQTKDRIKYE